MTYNEQKQLAGKLWLIFIFTIAGSLLIHDGINIACKQPIYSLVMNIVGISMLALVWYPVFNYLFSKRGK